MSTDLNISRKTMFYMKLKLVGTTVFCCCMGLLLLLHRSPQGKDLLDPDTGGSLFWTITCVMAVSAGLSLVRIPKEKRGRREEEPGTDT